jgi:hypothetical protein
LGGSLTSERGGVGGVREVREKNYKIFIGFKDIFEMPLVYAVLGQLTL